MNVFEPFSNLDETVKELGLDGKIREFFKLVKEGNRKDDANECTLAKCPDCEGLLVQVPQSLPLVVECISCGVKSELKNLIEDVK